jgi:pyruvate dehydrogenase E2 component (dihydrolipoamide acetyltransferase)
MISKVFMPKLGETMTEATVERWLKKEGDSVSVGEIILEITTDKATLEVEAYSAGVLRKIIVPKWKKVPVNTVIALVGDANEPLPTDIPTVVEAAPSAAKAVDTKATEAVAVAALAPSGKIIASPRARRFAETERIPLAILRGTGPGGRIVESDVQQYAQKVAERSITPAAREIAWQRSLDLLAVKGTGPQGLVTKEDVLTARPAAPAARGRREELSAMRRVIAERLSQSKREIPHFYIEMDMDMTAAVAFRKKYNEKGDKKLSYNDMLMKACAIAYAAVPDMNCTWRGDHLWIREEVNIGLAVALDKGLIVPVVRNVAKKTLDEISEESRRLVEKARGKRLTPDEYEGGCLTISNLGMFDVDVFLPIINPGESAILGLGRIVERPVVLDGGIRIRSMVTVVLAGDHRAIDGATAAQFLKKVKETLADPECLLKA